MGRSAGKSSGEVEARTGAGAGATGEVAVRGRGERMLSIGGDWLSSAVLERDRANEGRGLIDM